MRRKIEKKRIRRYVLILGNLSIADLLLEGGLAKINVGVEALGVEPIADLLAEVVEVGVDGDEHHLAGAEPQRPLAAVVLAEDGEHSLDTAEHGAMDNDRPGELLALLLGVGGVLQIEADGELEIELDGGALVDAVHGIHDLDVDLGTVEGAVAGVDAPSALAGEGIHGPGERGLGTVPKGHVAESLLGPGGQFELVGHSKRSVDTLHELQGSLDLFLDLVLPAEDVAIVLLEPTDTSEAGEGTGKLVAVEGAKVGEAEGQVAVRADGRLEHEAVAGTVHGLHGPLLPLHVKDEHGVLVVHGVAGLVPQVEVVNVGRDDLVEAALPVVVLDEIDELVVDAGAVGEPEGRSGR